MRQIVLDTETTGLTPEEGHKIIEIGCIELIDRQLTDNKFHVYINPQRSVDAGALAVHGLSNDFLADKPTFAEIVDDFVAYIEGAEIIAHNAPFDIGFINHELKQLPPKFKPLTEYVTVFDTLELARKLHPGLRNNLDALCKRYKVDNAKRNLHGALLDADLLAEVYLRMTGGQVSLFEDNAAHNNSLTNKARAKRKVSMLKRRLKVLYANEQELALHQTQLAAIRKKSDKCLWDDER